jgi:hypothetical protein
VVSPQQDPEQDVLDYLKIKVQKQNFPTDVSRVTLNTSKAPWDKVHEETHPKMKRTQMLNPISPVILAAVIFIDPVHQAEPDPPGTLSISGADVAFKQVRKYKDIQEPTSIWKGGRETGRNCRTLRNRQDASFGQ